MLAKAGPKADRSFWIVAGTIEQVDAEPVSLRFRVANRAGVAAEIAEEAARDMGLIEADPVPEDIVSKFVRHYDG